MDLEAMVDQLYEASIVPERWCGVLADLTRSIGAQGTVLAATRGTELIKMVGSSPEILESITEYQRRYPGNERIIRLMSEERAEFVQDIDLASSGEIILDYTYNEYLIPRGQGTGAATVVKTPTGEDVIIHAEFAYTGQPVSGAIVERLNDLRPHFARAALLSSRLGMERARGMAATLDALGLPGAVLRRNGTIMAANTRFQDFIPHVVLDRRARAVLANESADKVFAATLMQYGVRGALAMPASIPISAAGGRSAMIVHLLPVRGAAIDIFNEAGLIMIVTPVDRAIVPSADVLQGLFDLTPAEARTAREIGQTRSIDDIAAAQNISRETVRGHLKAVLSKTGLSRQQELVSLLAGKALPGG